MASINSELLGNFPKSVNRSDPVFSSFIANEKGTGATESVLTEAQKYAREYTGTPNVYKQTENMLSKSVTFFSFLERFANETEESWKRRFGAIFVRNGDTVWGTSFNIKNVFKQYFPSATIYLVENTADIESENVICDGDFVDKNAWILNGCTYSNKARFSKSYGVEFSSQGTLSQSVSLECKHTYFLHFFLKGWTRVLMQDNNGRFWNDSLKEWQAIESYSIFTRKEWENCFLWFKTDERISSVTLTFIGEDTLSGFIDYVRLFKKEKQPSFTLIAHFKGDTGEGALTLAPGRDDTQNLQNPVYDSYGHYDSSFITGVASGYAKDIYQDLLDIVRAQGVKAYIETVNRDYGED